MGPSYKGGCAMRNSAKYSKRKRHLLDNLVEKDHAKNTITETKDINNEQLIHNDDRRWSGMEDPRDN